MHLRVSRHTRKDARTHTHTHTHTHHVNIMQYVLPSLPPPPTEMMVVNVVNYSTVELTIPALVYHHMAEDGAWWRRCGSRVRVRA